MKLGSYRLAFIAACIADISACSAISPVDDYMTTHNLYGDLCKALDMERGDAGSGYEKLDATCADDELNLNEGRIQNEKDEDTHQEEAL